MSSRSDCRYGAYGPPTSGPSSQLQPEPVQRVEDLLLAVGAEARPVGVLDAQHELAALLAREREVEQRHVGGADVRVAGGRRRDAQAGCGGGLLSHGAPILGTAPEVTYAAWRPGGIPRLSGGRRGW